MLVRSPDPQPLAHCMQEIRDPPQRLQPRFMQCFRQDSRILSPVQRVISCRIGRFVAGWPSGCTNNRGAAVLQARTRRLASDVQSLQRQLEAKDAVLAEMHDRVSEQEAVVTSQKALIQQMEEDIFRSAGCLD